MVEQEQNKITHVYLRSEDHCWVPALQLKTFDGKAKVAVPVFKNQQDILSCGKQGKQRYHDNQVVDLKDYSNNVLPMQNVDSNGNLEEYKDMVNLPFMHEAAILYNLKLRHIKEKPYTRTGDIVIAVNPYQWYDSLYSEDKRAYYANRLVWEQSEDDPRKVMEPHVYEASALAYKGLAFGEKNDQSILVSGESGAGKTETVKICLNHIASVQRGQFPPGYFGDSEFDPVVQRIIQSNPLLEAFGNAKTKRNDNSSRFGKFLQLQFDRNSKPEPGIKSARCKLVGSKCDVYLLEKNRVLGHENGERTFHIFYQLLAAPDQEKTKFWEGLRGAKNDTFKYVGHTDTDTIEGVKDSARFQQTIEALELVGIKADKLETLIKSLCIVLQLGNLGFKELNGDSDKSAVATKNDLSVLSELMGISQSELTLAFTERTFKTANETHKVPLNADAANEARDALAKEIYQKSFLWLVSAINSATCAEEIQDKTYGTISLLDIFGFEAFRVNRFEQLCINYANEKLQQKFTEDIFKNVQAEYRAEGISLAEIWYDDNTDVLDLIEGRTGLLNLLNEECIRPKGNDFEFVQKALQINKDSPCLIVHRTDRLSFGINHYAGSVMYDAEAFVSKNLDTLPTDLQECAEKCNNAIVKAPRSEPVKPVTRTRGVGSHNRGKQVVRGESNIVAPTVWTKYKTQLSSLMTSLRKTESRYIRCIKPNNQKAPLLMEHEPVVEQLRCAGVVAGITIARSVFPNNLSNSVALARYSYLWDVNRYPSAKTNDMTPEQKRAEDCKAMMNCVLKCKEQFVDGKCIKAFTVGKTKTYFRAGALEYLESNRMSGLDAQAIIIQRAARGWLARNRGKNANQRRKMLESERMQAAAERKAQMAREREERIAAQKAEEQELLDEIDQLEQSLKRVELEKTAAILKARERVEGAKRDLELAKEELVQQEEGEVKVRLMEKARQEKKLEENIKIIQMLKRENMRVLQSEANVREKVEKESSKINMLEEGNRSLGDNVDHISDEATEKMSKYESLQERVEDAKVSNRELKRQVHKQQDLYMEQAEARLTLQKTLAAILTNIQESSVDQNLVEEIVLVALGVESEAKSLMASLDFETSEPSLMASDISEGDDSHSS